MIDLAEMVLDRTTRARALEIALLGHVLIDAKAPHRIGAVPLSAAAMMLVGLIQQDHTASRAALVAYARIQLRLLHAVGVVDRSRCRDVLRLASHASRVSVGDLAGVGQIENVARLLWSIRDDENATLLHTWRAA